MVCNMGPIFLSMTTLLLNTVATVSGLIVIFLPIMTRNKMNGKYTIPYNQKSSLQDELIPTLSSTETTFMFLEEAP